jgi:hypothetical protein
MFIYLFIYFGGDSGLKVLHSQGNSVCNGLFSHPIKRLKLSFKLIFSGNPVA